MQAKSNLESEHSPPTKTGDKRLLINRFVLFFVVMAAGLAADLITKSIAFNHHFDPQNPGGEPSWWIDGVFGVQTSTNGGALFGIGQGGSAWFAALSLVALAAVLFWLFYKKLARSLWLTITLGLVSGGILGNFYDRIGLGYKPEWEWDEIRYHVRDWIHFRWEGIQIFDPWPNFNIADSLLVCGAIMLFLFAIFGKTDVENAGKKSSEPAATSDA